MKILRIAAVLLLCLCLLPACAKNPLPDGVVAPETHAEAINPASVTSVRFVHYDTAGVADLDLTLESASPYVPLLATVYDKAVVADESAKSADRAKVFEMTLTLDGGKTIELAVYSDMTMEQAGGPLFDGADMDAFLRSFLPVPRAEETGTDAAA